MEEIDHISAKSVSKTEQDFPSASATFSVLVQQNEKWKPINNKHKDISQNLICEQNGCVDLGSIEVKMSCSTSGASLIMKLFNTSSATRKPKILESEDKFILGDCKGREGKSEAGTELGKNMETVSTSFKN